MENAFKHSRFVQSGAVKIQVRTTVKGNRFSLSIQNNYNKEREHSSNGIGLTNVKRRLEVLYPYEQHQLTISKDDSFYSINLQLELVHKI